MTAALPMAKPEMFLDGLDLSDPAEGTLLPPRAFTSRDVYERELRTVFAQSWVHVADVHDVPKPGDYRAGTIGQVPVVVVRDQDGELRGFVNACRHRNAALVDGSGNCGTELKCPYHAWSYKTDGSLAGVPYRDEFDEAQLQNRNLVPIRLGTVGPLVFGCLSEDAPPLETWAGQLVDAAARAHANDMRAVFEFEYDVPVNWKVYVENALEGYHIGFVHDVLNEFVVQREATHEFEDHSSYTYAPITERFLAMAPRPDYLTGKDATHVRFGHVFPNLIPVITPGELSYLRIDPVGHDRIRLRARSFDIGGPIEQLEEFRKESFDRTNKQDIGVVTRVQQGLQADHLPAGVHSNMLECRIGHFERMVVRALRAQ